MPNTAKGTATPARKPATKLPTMTSIIRDEQPWGVRLLCKPFRMPTQATTMEISADIHYPKTGHNPEINFWFSGVPIGTPLRATDTVIWITAITEMNQQARKIAADLKDTPMPVVKKKPAKKKK